MESPREPSSTPALRSLEINSLINGERPLTLNTLNNKINEFVDPIYFLISHPKYPIALRGIDIRLL